jgi:ankyrin repeat protein
MACSLPVQAFSDVLQLLTLPELDPVLQPNSALQVWDLCNLTDARVAASALDTSTSLAIGARAAASSSVPSRQTALHVSAFVGDADLTRTLLLLGACVDCRSKSGATPLFSACEAGHTSVARSLLAAGADMWIPTANLENCLYISALRGHSEVRF